MTKLEGINLEIIRYANCWEDADILLSVCPDNPKKILSVGSGGDNSFALLSKNPEQIIVADISKVQLYLIELKKVAIANLNHAEYLAFAGFTEATDRYKTYQLFRNQLSTDAANYWDKHLVAINKGIIHCGKFENYFRLFRQIVLPLTHRKSTQEQLFVTRTPQQQQDFYRKHWQNPIWKTLSGIFFSRFVQGRLGRSPRFLKYAGKNIGQMLQQNIKQHIENPASAQNYFLHYIITGNFTIGLPFYARAENYEVIKQNLHCLQLAHKPAEELISTEKNIDFYNLSNIFEYMDKTTFANFAQTLAQTAQTNAVFAYWNLFVNRELNTKNEQIISTNHTIPYNTPDKGFFYSRFFVDKKC